MNHEDETLKKLEETVEELGRRHVWPTEDVEDVKSIIKVYRGFKALGVLAGATKQILLWIGVFAGALIAFRAGVLDWLGIPK